MDLAELEQNRARLTASHRSIVVTFDYYPERVGMAFQRALAAASRPPHDVGPIADQLPGIVAEWDLTRGGQPIPITAEGIGSLPMGISSAIGRAIMEDFGNPKSPVSMAATSASSTPSPATSSPAAAWATAPTSPSPSSTPAGQDSSPGTSSGFPIPAGS